MGCVDKSKDLRLSTSFKFVGSVCLLGFLFLAYLLNHIHALQYISRWTGNSAIPFNPAMDTAKFIMRNENHQTRTEKPKQTPNETPEESPRKHKEPPKNSESLQSAGKIVLQTLEPKSAQLLEDTGLHVNNVSEMFIDCGEVVNTTMLGRGRHKIALKGFYHGIPVALKLQLQTSNFTTSCLSKGHSSSYCNGRISSHIWRDIVMSIALGDSHAVKLYGLCVKPGGEFAGIITELGEQLNIKMLNKLSFKDRLEVCRNVTKIIDFYHTSKLGSLGHSDCRLSNFVFVDGKLKLCDVGNTILRDSRCTKGGNCVFNRSGIELKTDCVAGRCEHMNVRSTILRCGVQFVANVLANDIPDKLRPSVDELVKGYTEASMTIQQLLESIETIQQKG